MSEYKEKYCGAYELPPEKELNMSKERATYPTVCYELTEEFCDGHYHFKYKFPHGRIYLREHPAGLKRCPARHKKKEPIVEEREYTWENFDCDYNDFHDQVQAIRNFPMDKSKKILFICGSPGAGKSHCIQAVRQEVHDMKKTYMIITAEELGQMEWTELCELHRNDFVCIDDMGRERPIDRMRLSINLINLIESFKGKVIITTNDSCLSELKHKYKDNAERLSRRLDDKTGEQVTKIRMEGKPWEDK